jgi:hypothetical protein
VVLDTSPHHLLHLLPQQQDLCASYALCWQTRLNSCQKTRIRPNLTIICCLEHLRLRDASGSWLPVKSLTAKPDVCTPRTAFNTPFQTIQRFRLISKRADLLLLTVLLGLCCCVLYGSRPLKYSTVWQYQSSKSLHQALQHM